jgi:threonylcarbamoyladenosine tRNA methylthiotransferase MtaB
MPQVPHGLIRERAARLRAAGAAALERSLARRVGQTARVLVERDGFGRSEHYAPVRFTGAIATGEIAALRIRAATPQALIGAVP